MKEMNVIDYREILSDKKWLDKLKYRYRLVVWWENEKKLKLNRTAP